MNRRCALVAAVLAVAAGGRAWAQGVPCPEFRANQQTASDQRHPHVASAGNGDFVVVWETYGQDGSHYGVFGRRYDAGGTPLGPEFQANTYTTGIQWEPAVSSDESGNTVVVWADGARGRILGQRYNRAGAPLGGEFVAGTAAAFGYFLSISDPAVAHDSAGNFVVVWGSPDPAGAMGIYGRRFDASGALLSSFAVNGVTAGDQRNPGVAVHPNGDFMVVWETLAGDGSQEAVFGRRFAANTTPLGDDFRVNTVTLLGQRYARVAAAADGGFMVVFTSTDADQTGIVGRRYDAAGVAAAPELAINTTTFDDQSLATVARDSNGGFVVAWNADGQDGSQSGIVGRRLDRAGTPVGGEFQVNTVTAGFQFFPVVAPGPAGGFVAVWESTPTIGVSDYDAEGSVECARLYAVTPCRLADTRTPPGTPLPANTDRVFPVAGRCGIPLDARALAVNVTAVNPTDSGFLRLYPAGVTAPFVSAVNFVPGRTRANNADIVLGTDGQLAVRCDMPAGSTGTTHVVLDVYGYFKR